MALTDFQRRLCLLLAEQRKANGESYVAGGAALNQALQAPRLSRDVDLFHDTEAALAATWPVDRAAIQAAGLSFRLVREGAAFVQADVTFHPGSIRGAFPELRPDLGPGPSR